MEWAQLATAKQMFLAKNAGSLRCLSAGPGPTDLWTFHHPPAALISEKQMLFPRIRTLENINKVKATNVTEKIANVVDDKKIRK